MLAQRFTLLCKCLLLCSNRSRPQRDQVSNLLTVQCVYVRVRAVNHICMSDNHFSHYHLPNCHSSYTSLSPLGIPQAYQFSSITLPFDHPS